MASLDLGFKIIGGNLRKKISLKFLQKFKPYREKIIYSEQGFELEKILKFSFLSL